MSKKSRAVEAPIRAIVAIDPAGSAGIAVVAEGRVLTARPAAGDRFATLAPAVKAAWLASGCEVPMHEVLGIVEGWHSARGGKGAHTLAMRRGLAQAALEAIGITRFHMPLPSQWQNAFFGSIYGKDTKQLSVGSATSLLGTAPVNDDVADSVCLGMWAWQTFCMKQST